VAYENYTKNFFATDHEANLSHAPTVSEYLALVEKATGTVVGGIKTSPERNALHLFG
jgi:hypothetical protein